VKHAYVSVWQRRHAPCTRLNLPLGDRQTDASVAVADPIPIGVRSAYMRDTPANHHNGVSICGGKRVAASFGIKSGDHTVGLVSQEEEEKQAAERALSHAAKAAPAPAWGPQDSAELYNVAGWGSPYFHISDRGLLAVRPHGNGAWTWQYCGMLLWPQRHARGRPTLPLPSRSTTTLEPCA